MFGIPQKSREKNSPGGLYVCISSVIRTFAFCVALCVPMFAAHACAPNEIDAGADGCRDAVFSLEIDLNKASENDDGLNFNFWAGFAGTLYIDWGDDTPVTIINNEYAVLDFYTHTYTNDNPSNSTRTVRFASSNMTAYHISPWDTGTISFGYNNLITKVNEGSSLSNLFPPIPTSYDEHECFITPSFAYTFVDCGNLQSIPNSLFRIGDAADEVGGVFFHDGAFDGTFLGCKNLKSLPNGLFKNVQFSSCDSDVGNNSFYSTFSGSGLTSLPPDLFYNTETGTNMFLYTFLDTALQEIPSGLFANLNGPMYTCCINEGDASHCGPNEGAMFYGTFSYCNDLTTIPVDLFKNIRLPDVQYENDNLYNGTLPADANLQYGLFYTTFAECPRLSKVKISDNYVVDYIPYSMFINLFYNVPPDEIPGTNIVEGMFRNTGLRDDYQGCPISTERKLSRWIFGWEYSEWGTNKVVCDELPCTGRLLHILKDGHNHKMCMKLVDKYQDQFVEHGLRVRDGDRVYFANASTDPVYMTAPKGDNPPAYLRVKSGNDTYYIYDDSGLAYTQSQQ